MRRYPGVRPFPSFAPSRAPGPPHPLAKPSRLRGGISPRTGAPTTDSEMFMGPHGRIKPQYYPGAPVFTSTSQGHRTSPILSSVCGVLHGVVFLGGVRLISEALPPASLSDLSLCRRRASIPKTTEFTMVDALPRNPARIVIQPPCMGLVFEAVVCSVSS